jgi:O-antigen/teichoic acid export membrane protein
MNRREALEPEPSVAAAVPEYPMLADSEAPKVRSVAWNGFWTVAMTSSTGLIAVILPPFLARILTHDEYGAWALSLQVASYVLVLGFGLQGAVGRFVALAHGPRARAARDGVVVAAFHMTCAAAVAGIVLAALAAVALPHFLTEMPVELMGHFRIALLLCCVAAALALTGMPFIGAFLGEQRAHVPAMLILLGRAVQSTLMVLVALRYRSLEALALAYCVGQAAITLGQALAWRGGEAAGSLWRPADRAHYRDLARFCAPFVLWNSLAALSFGSDLLIVSKLDFAATPYYAVSLTVATSFVAFLAAGYNSLLPAAARHVGAADRRALLEMLMRGGRVGVGISLAIGVPLMLAAVGPLTLWVGSSYAQAAAPYVALLILAQIVRLSMSMYGSVTIAAGLHRAVLLAPVLDASVGLLVGIGLGSYMGATGVALGMIAGAAASFTTWYAKDPLREVFHVPHVARAFLRACAPPVATAAVGCALAGGALLGLGLVADDWARLGASLAVGAAVAAVGLHRPAASATEHESAAAK